MVISRPDAVSRSEPAADLSADSPVTPAMFQIMLALAAGQAHGYGIMRLVDQLSGGRMRLGPGTLYRSIQRMVVTGLIEEREVALDDEPEDDRRRYYRLTAAGLAVARAEAKRLATLVDIARSQKLLASSKTGGKR